MKVNQLSFEYNLLDQFQYKHIVMIVNQANKIFEQQLKLKLTLIVPNLR